MAAGTPLTWTREIRAAKFLRFLPFYGNLLPVRHRTPGEARCTALGRGGRGVLVPAAGVGRPEPAHNYPHQRPAEGKSSRMNAPRSGAGWLTGRRGLFIGAAGLAAVAATVVVVSSAAADGRPPLVPATGGGGGSRSVALTSGPVRKVELIGL